MTITDNIGCINNTIKVAAGHYFDLANPQADDIDLQSIASALSKTCRYGGHCPRLYSVAEHSVYAMKLASEDGHGIDVLKAVLLHDAAEAYICDLPKPLKMMLPDYAAIERRVEQAVAKRFSVSFYAHKSAIKHYDRIMLKAEKKHFWPEDQSQWFGLDEIPNRKVEFKFSIPPIAEAQFLGVARSLGIE